jgi:hypothetical protein
VPKFVKQNACEQCEYETHTDQRRIDALRTLPVREPDENEEQQKREVHMHIDAKYSSNFRRPFHLELPLLRTAAQRAARLTNGKRMPNIRVMPR